MLDFSKQIFALFIMLMALHGMFRLTLDYGIPPKEQGLTFVSPLEGRITSRFGFRKRPTAGASQNHSGIDIAAPKGTAIHSTAPGEVIKVGRHWAKGLFVEIDHGEGYESRYYHLSRATVKERQRVDVGHKVGEVGTTGVSTGPHLHFEIRKEGQPEDPAIYVGEFAL